MTARRALVSLPESAWKIIDHKLKGQLGDGDAEIIRNIVMLYFIQHGYIMKDDKTVYPVNEIGSLEEVLGQLDIHDSQIESLVELLEEKGLIDTDEWSRRIKKKMQKTK
jgi:hypothetical protein